MLSDLRIISLGQTGPWQDLVWRDIVIEAAQSGRRVKLRMIQGWGSELNHHTYYAVEQEFIRSVTLCHPYPHALLLVLPIGPDVEAVRRDVERAQQHMSFLSKRAWRHVMVVFVCYYRITAATLTPHREILEELLTKCEGRYSVVTVEQPNMELLQRIDQMASENWRDFLQPETPRKTPSSTVFRRIHRNGFVFVLTAMLFGLLSGCIINIKFALFGLNLGFIVGLVIFLFAKSHQTDS